MKQKTNQNIKNIRQVNFPLKYMCLSFCLKQFKAIRKDATNNFDVKVTNSSPYQSSKIAQDYIMLLPWDINVHELSFKSLNYGNTYNIEQMYVLFDVIIRWKITLHNKRTYNFYIATDTQRMNWMRRKVKTWMEII